MAKNNGERSLKFMAVKKILFMHKMATAPSATFLFRHNVDGSRRLTSQSEVAGTQSLGPSRDVVEIFSTAGRSLRKRSHVRAAGNSNVKWRRI